MSRFPIDYGMSDLVRNGLVLFLVTLVLGACGGRQMTALSSSDTTAVREVLRAQQAAWNRGDIDGFMDGYLRSEELVFTSGAEVRRGWEATIARYRQRYGHSRDTMGTLAFDILEIQSLGADGAVVLGRWSLSHGAGGIFSVALRRTEVGWKIVHDHTSSSAQ